MEVVGCGGAGDVVVLVFGVGCVDGSDSVGVGGGPGGGCGVAGYGGECGVGGCEACGKTNEK